MDKEFIYLVTKSGSLMGSYDDSRWVVLPWYKRLYGFINKRYKQSFIDFKPIEVK